MTTRFYHFYSNVLITFKCKGTTSYGRILPQLRSVYVTGLVLSEKYVNFVNSHHQHLLVKEDTEEESWQPNYGTTTFLPNVQVFPLPFTLFTISISPGLSLPCVKGELERN